MRRALHIAAFAASIGAVRLPAQANDVMYARLAAASGWEARGYTFSPGIGAKSVWQWNVPIVVLTPLGRRASIDLTGHYASARFETAAGETVSLHGFTDTQLRLLFMPRRDRFVVSMAFNLPSGQASIATNQYAVAGAVGSNFLSFPIANFGAGFGVTAGFAYARQAGAWNLGVSASGRYVAPYAPFSDNATSYSPGIEGRFRGGVDRLIGSRSRVLLGITASTFSTDAYTGANSLSLGSYSPGARFITDLTWLTVLGRVTLSAAAWDLYRLAGSGSTGSHPETKENLFHAELRLGVPVTRRVQLEPLAAVRQWNPANYLGGRLMSGGLAIRATPLTAWTLVASGRYDRGWISDRTSGGSADLQGYGMAVLLRYSR